MLLFEQLDFFGQIARGQIAREVVSFRSFRQENGKLAAPPTDLPIGRDDALESEARRLLEKLGATKLAREVRVEWNARLRSAAGRAEFRDALVSLNPRLREIGRHEIDRTLRHELAHLLAQSRAGGRRLAPHGPEWRRACRDLGIADEVRCHTLPLPTSMRARRYLYRCPSCATDFPRVHRLRRAMACLACCRKHNRGQFDQRFQLELIRAIRPNE